MDTTDLLRLAYEIALKVRLLREYEKAHAVGDKALNDRDLLALELISTFSPLKEKQLGKVLGIQTSALADLIKRLVRSGYVIRGRNRHDKRERPLRLSDKGRRFFASIKRRSARRYLYLFSNIPEITAFQQAESILETIDANVMRQIRIRIFGQQDDFSADESSFENLLGLDPEIGLVNSSSGLWLPTVHQQIHRPSSSGQG